MLKFACPAQSILCPSLAAAAWSIAYATLDILVQEETAQLAGKVRTSPQMALTLVLCAALGSFLAIRALELSLNARIVPIIQHLSLAVPCCRSAFAYQDILACQTRETVRLVLKDRLRVMRVQLLVSSARRARMLTVLHIPNVLFDRIIHFQRLGAQASHSAHVTLDTLDLLARVQLVELGHSKTKQALQIVLSVMQARTQTGQVNPVSPHAWNVQNTRFQHLEMANSSIVSAILGTLETILCVHLVT